MRQLTIARYAPTALATERGVLTLLQAALRVAQQTLRDEHPELHATASIDAHAPLVVEAAALIHGRCDELLRLLDLYDRAVDQACPLDDDHIPF